ncbi:hypothetical protein ACFVHW_04290 [Streptomyces sp. NPDC127110]|uniref:hypothetical protein n=1 Tax=Streptomyces sp. NPDC127110 TaxID=3345362 RepID=UPI0036404105
MHSLMLLAPGEIADHLTAHGRVRMKKFGSGGWEFVRAAAYARQPAGDGALRAALSTLRPAAYLYAGAWLAALAEHAPARADYRQPDMAPESVRLLARMTRTHANGVPRVTDGSVGWSVEGASARVWPDGRVEVRGDGGVVLAVRLEGSGWDSGRVAAVADAGLRLLCGPGARHMTRTSEPSGWDRPLSRWGGDAVLAAGRDRKGGQVYDGVSVARCSCGWVVSAVSRLGARAAAAGHVRAVGG